MSTTDCSKAKNWGPVFSNALLFSEELKTEFVLCDGQLSFSHWILQVEPSPCLVATFSMTWTLPWPNRQDTDSPSFSSSFSLNTIARPLIVFHVPSADGVDELYWLSSPGSWSWILERLHSQQLQHFRFSEYPTPRATSLADKISLCRSLPILRPILCQTRSSISFSLSVSMMKTDTTFSLFFGGIFTEANAKYPRRILKAINNAKIIRTCCVEARTRYHVTSSYMTRVWQILSTIN